MPTPTGSTNSTDITLSGDSLIDSLVYGTKWGGSLGSGAMLSYSFLSNNSYYAARYSFDNEYLNSYQLSSNQKTAVTQALDAWAAVANIDFSLTVDSSTNTGDLRFGGYAGMDSGTAAWAYLPGSGPVAGDVWIGPATSDANPTPGTYDYLTFVHEIGHALGLKHSFESDSSNPNVLPTEYEDVRYTVMSYSDAYSFEPTTPMLLDIAAIQYLYGANMQWQTGNNTYQWAADKPVFETIWDAGGTDTLNASNQTAAVTLNLNPGTFSSIGQSFLKYEISGATSINYGLAIAYGTRIENAVGSAYADTLIGNQWANVLDGLAGGDTMSGGDGSDSYYVDDIDDIVSETNATASTGGTDTVYSYLAAYTLGANIENLRLLAGGTTNGTGNDLDNLIYASTGNNILDGGAGSDTAAYSYAASAVTVNLATTSAQATGGSGSDTLLNIENLTGSKYNDKLTGNSAANTLNGGTGGDTLNGGAGADLMIGGDGSDSYYVDDIDDIVSETNATASTGGTDTVYSYLAAYTLGANIENLRLLAGGTTNGTGNDLDNLIYASTGNNILDGGAGSDTAAYSYAASAVTVNLATTSAQATGGSGSDTLLNIENLTGSKYNDELTGNSAANTLSGGTGNDTLTGGNGNDLLIGGLGTDTFYGGLDADRFDFNALSEMGLGALRDVIGDFNSSEGDQIDLSTLDADTSTTANDAFSFIGSDSFSNTNAAGQLRFLDGILYGSTNADANAEFEIQLLGVTSLNSTDLIA